MTSTTRSVRRWRMRKAIVSRVAGSAQWRSSMTNRTGRDLRQPLEDAEDGVEEAGLVRFASGSPSRPRRPGRGRHETGELRSGPCRGPSRARRDRASRGERPECLDDRPVRARPRRRCPRSRPEEDAHPAGGRHLRRLADQAGLPDAGLAGDQLVDRGPGDGACRGRGPWRRVRSTRPTSVGLTRRRGIVR